jgi:hypothetical protein
MMMDVKKSVEWELTGENEVLGENLPRCQFVHHKSHMIWPGLEPRFAVVGSRPLTAWAVARPGKSLRNFSQESQCPAGNRTKHLVTTVFTCLVTWFTFPVVTDSWRNVLSSRWTYVLNRQGSRLYLEVARCYIYGYFSHLSVLFSRCSLNLIYLGPVYLLLLLLLLLLLVGRYWVPRYLLKSQSIY